MSRPGSRGPLRGKTGRALDPRMRGPAYGAPEGRGGGGPRRNRLRQEPPADWTPSSPGTLYGQRCHPRSYPGGAGQKPCAPCFAPSTLPFPVCLSSSEGRCRRRPAPAAAFVPEPPVLGHASSAPTHCPQSAPRCPRSTPRCPQVPVLDPCPPYPQRPSRPARLASSAKCHLLSRGVPHTEPIQNRTLAPHSPASRELSPRSGSSHRLSPPRRTS